MRMSEAAGPARERRNVKSISIIMSKMATRGYVLNRRGEACTRQSTENRRYLYVVFAYGKRPCRLRAMCRRKCGQNARYLGRATQSAPAIGGEILRLLKKPPTPPPWRRHHHELTKIAIKYPGRPAFKLCLYLLARAPDELS